MEMFENSLYVAKEWRNQGIDCRQLTDSPTIICSGDFKWRARQACGVQLTPHERELLAQEIANAERRKREHEECVARREAAVRNMSLKELTEQLTTQANDSDGYMSSVDPDLVLELVRRVKEEK